MATSLTLGRLEPNKDVVGGLKAVYFADYTTSVFGTATVAATDEITAFSSAITLFKYELKGSNSIDEANPNSRENGTSFWEGSGSITLKKQDLATRKEMKLLSRERVLVVSEDYNGNFKIHGIHNGCEISIATASGAGMGDLSGYTLEITFTEQEPSYFLDSSIIDDAINTNVTVGT